MLVSKQENKVEFTTLIFILILALTTLAHVTGDMYVPALPIITKNLHADRASIQLSLALYLLGFSFSHLFYGPISDRIGRKKPLLIGIGLSIIGGLICIASFSAFSLIIGRLIQGLGIGVCNSVGRSVTRDLLSGTQLAKMGSHLSMVNALFLATAPTIGGYILYYLSWHFIFVFLIMYAIIIWILIYFKLPETNFHLNPNATKLNTILKNYFTLLKSKAFMGFTLCASMAYAGLFAYLTAGPFLLQNKVGLSPIQFGWLAFFVAGSVFLSSFVNSRFVIKKGILTMLSYGVTLMLASGLVMLIFAMCGFLNTFVIIFPIALFCLGAGLTFANSFAGAFHFFPRMAGGAGGLFGCLQILGGSLTSMSMAFFHKNNQIPLACVFILLGLISLYALIFLAIPGFKSGSVSS